MTVTWQKLTPVHKPLGRNRHQLVYDPVRDVAWLYGGFTAGGIVTDTWKWDGTDWTQMTPVLSPTNTGTPNFDIYIATGSGYHLSTNKVVTTGWLRRGASTYLSAETWIWDPVALNWTHPAPAHQTYTAASESGGGFAMSHVNQNNKVFRFGSSSGAGNTNKTGYWNGTDWTNVVPATLPPVDGAASVGYDPIRKRVVAYLSNASGRPTYEWTGTNWVLVPTVHVPTGNSGVQGNNLGWHPTLKKLILIVPTSFAGNSETWSYDGKDWIRLFPITNLPSLSTGRLARDPSRSDALMHHGGQDTGSATNRDETWILIDSAPVTVIPVMNNLIKLSA